MEYDIEWHTEMDWGKLEGKKEAIIIVETYREEYSMKLIFKWDNNDWYIDGPLSNFAFEEFKESDFKRFAIVSAQE